MKKLAIFSLLIGLIIVIGISIWLGFPSPHYDRAAITIVSYILGAGAIFVGIAVGSDTMGQ